MHLEEGVDWVKKTDCKTLSEIPLVLAYKKIPLKITPTLYVLGRTLAFTRERKSSWCSLRAEIWDHILCKIPIYMC